MSGSSFYDARRKENSLTKWAKVGVGAMFFNAVGAWGTAFVFAHAFKGWSNEFSQTPGQQTYYLDQHYSGWGQWWYAVSATATAVAVLFLIWQHSAATVARSLGYPARRSPALGVGAWSIPIVNFWFPYQALRDLLPPGHPDRPRCLQAWLAWLGAGLANLVGFFLALASTGAAVVAIVVAALLVIYAVFTGIRLVDAVYEDHTRRLASVQY